MFLVNKTNRCTEFQFYWYYKSTYFGQPFCPSSGVLSRTSALVYFMQIWWPCATMFRAVFLPIVREFLVVYRLWYILCRLDSRVLPGAGWNFVLCSILLLLLEPVHLPPCTRNNVHKCRICCHNNINTKSSYFNKWF